MALTLIFLTLALIHVYWARGGRTGSDVCVPSREGRVLFNPSPAACYLVAGLLGVAAVVAFTRFRPGLYAIAVLFSLRAVGDFRYLGFFKTVKDTPFARWDTRLFSPLCILIALLALQ